MPVLASWLAAARRCNLAQPLQQLLTQVQPQKHNSRTHLGRRLKGVVPRMVNVSWLLQARRACSPLQVMCASGSTGGFSVPAHRRTRLGLPARPGCGSRDLDPFGADHRSWHARPRALAVPSGARNVQGGAAALATVSNAIKIPLSCFRKRPASRHAPWRRAHLLHCARLVVHLGRLVVVLLSVWAVDRHPWLEV